jgi:hypothetical protein
MRAPLQHILHVQHKAHARLDTCAPRMLPAVLACTTQVHYHPPGELVVLLPAQLLPATLALALAQHLSQLGHVPLPGLLHCGCMRSTFGLLGVLAPAGAQQKARLMSSTCGA